MAATQTTTRRVRRLRELMGERGYDAVVLRHNPDLRWLTGAERTFDDEAAHTAFVTQDGLWLHTDSRYYHTFLDRLGEGTPWQVDMEQVGAARWVAARVRASHARVVAVEDTITLGLFEDLRGELRRASVEVLLPRLHGDVSCLRIVKDQAEVDLMAQAQAITDAAFEHICGYIKAGMTELEVRSELEGYMFSHGADALSFDTIVAAGPNGANPHAQPSDYVIREGDLIVMDYGAGLRDYHSDMTRTVCVGRPSDEQRKVYDVVRHTNEAVAATLRAGVVGRDMQELAVRLISEAGYGDFFGHGLGHGVGLEIHERPFLGRTYEGVVPEGSVVTDEPGIYLPGRFGVRLEDFGVVRQDGYQVLTQSTHELVSVGA